MVIYGTFCGFKNVHNEVSKFKWDKLVDGCGREIKGIYISENQFIFDKLRMKFGNRYRLTFDEMKDDMMVNVTNVFIVNKNPKCDVFRRYKDEYHMVGGKYQGKRNIDLPDDEMARYCIWLAENTYNEATIRNTLQILNNITKQ
jgi:uncharacterized protein (DUF3820 family)